MHLHLFKENVQKQNIYIYIYNIKQEGDVHIWLIPQVNKYSAVKLLAENMTQQNNILILEMIIKHSPYPCNKHISEEKMISLFILSLFIFFKHLSCNQTCNGVVL